MLIGIDCFKDTEIRSIIENQNRKESCQITGVTDILVYDTNKENIKHIIMEVCKEIYSQDSLLFTSKVGMERLCDSDFLNRNSLLRESSWEKFMSSIKNINRFHSNHINLKLLEDFFNSPQMQRVIKKDTEYLYRARITDENGLKKEEMGPPPAKQATAGRANSAGISCLYLANDVATTFHEIRARDLDYISVASFKNTKELKIVDLSNLDNISPFSLGSFDYEWFAINISILKKISIEIAKPLRRQDSELDYLPAQYISDFVKSLGFDGICYKSTLNKNGLNYAFFDYKKFKCVEVKLYHVSTLSYKTDFVR